MFKNIKSKKFLLSILAGIVIGLLVSIVIAPPFWGAILGVVVAAYLIKISTPKEEALGTALETETALTFWNDRKKKLRSIYYLVLAVFVVTLPYSLYSIFIIPILYFPLGLIDLIIGIDNSLNLADPFAMIFLVWIVYFGLVFVIVSNNLKKVVVSIYIILIFLIFLNVVGCHAVAPSFMENVH